MKKRNQMNFIFLTIVLVLTISLPVLAEDYMDSPEIGVRYSRISAVYGDVDLEQSMSAESLAVRQNLPVLAGDRLTSGSDGSAELMVDDGSVIWLWNDTKLDLDRMEFTDEGRAQVTRFHLWFGVLAARFHEPTSDVSERVITIGPGEIIVQNNAMFFVESLGRDQACLAVMNGQVTLSHQGVYRIVRSGETVCIDATSDLWVDREYYPDASFMEWVTARDEELGNMSYTDNTPEDYQAAGADFEQHGRWVFYNSIWCWSPYVSAGWVPYHFGVWVWIPGWGWTWVPDEPWGWYPYHYGCWSYAYGYGWMWTPYWRWRTHWAAWRWHGRSVHWVAMHPGDRRDHNGLLASGAVPKNSLVKIGIPVEAGQSIDELLAGNPVQGGISSQKMPASISWHNKPPNSIVPGVNRNLRSHVEISPSYSQPLTHGGNKTRVNNRSQTVPDIRRTAPVQKRRQQPQPRNNGYPAQHPNLNQRSSGKPVNRPSNVQDKKQSENQTKKQTKKPNQKQNKKKNEKKRSPTEIWNKKSKSNFDVGKSGPNELSGSGKKSGGNSLKTK